MVCMVWGLQQGIELFRSPFFPGGANIPWTSGGEWKTSFTTIISTHLVHILILWLLMGPLYLYNLMTIINGFCEIIINFLISFFIFTEAAFWEVWFLGKLQYVGTITRETSEHLYGKEAVEWYQNQRIGVLFHRRTEEKGIQL